ncbi:MAG: biotin/lipoyl-binding protein [Phycisphaerales bacterium]|nr:biotin/lipoyl-binding protein [Planctomycetota bacterium]
MIRTFLIPLIAIAGMILAVVVVVKSSQPKPPSAPVAAPAVSPFASRVAGSGIIESSSQNIAIGTPVAGTVEKVAVVVGDRVKAGDVLFTLDSRDQRSLLAVREAEFSTAQENLKKLEAMPRKEEIGPAEARVEAAKANLEDLKNQLAIMERVNDPRARSEEEMSRRRFAVLAAQGRLDEANAQLALLLAGAWKPDLEVAKAQVRSAEANVQQVKTEIERRIIRAPINGRVLQVNIRPGEFAPAGAMATPLMMMGAVEKLNVRVDVDENDAWRVRAGARAEGSLRGNRDIKTPLTFVRFEPYVVPKKSLTGDSSERVDTRVLQVLFSFDPGSLPVFVGQQMDVYIDAAGDFSGEKPPAALSTPSDSAKNIPPSVSSSPESKK